MKLPDTVKAHGIPLDAEYDAMFSMTPKELGRMFSNLVADKSNIVVISIRKIGMENDVTFVKEKDQSSNGDSDEEALYPFRLHANDLLFPEKFNAEMEDRIRECGIEKTFCMTCLHDYLDRTFVECPNATKVTMYMAADETLPTFMFHTIPGGDNKEYCPDAPNHRYQQKSEMKEVRKRPMLYLNERDSDDEAERGEERAAENVGGPEGGKGNGNDNADGEGSGNGDGNGNENSDGEGSGNGNDNADAEGSGNEDGKGNDNADAEGSGNGDGDGDGEEQN